VRVRLRGSPVSAARTHSDMKKKIKPDEAAMQQAFDDLIERDAAPILERWFRKFVRAHKREPSDHEVDKAMREVIDQLTSDKWRYHFSNLKPVWNPDGRTWSLAHLHEHN
jgi:hypothetical protein